MGCIFRLGCLALLAILALVGWINRDRILGRDADPVAVAPTWERLSPAGAQRTRAALGRLQTRDGPVFVTLTGAEVASYVYLELGRALPSLADSAEAAVFEDRLVVRGTVPLRELGGAGALGPFASMLGDREPIEISGRLRVTSPGRGELSVSEIKVRDFKLPAGLVPRLLKQAGIDQPADGTAQGVIPVRLPAHVGDVRVADGRVTLYKNVQ